MQIINLASHNHVYMYVFQIIIVIRIIMTGKRSDDTKYLVYNGIYAMSIITAFSRGTYFYFDVL